MLIRVDDLSGDAVQALLALHLRGMHANSPPGAVFALGASGLTAPDVTVWSAWRDGELLGIAALRTLGPTAGEIKSMRTHPDHLGRGVGAALRSHLIDEARRRNFRRLSLETGSGPSFEPALNLYRTRGFAEGERFADYEQSAFNRFLHLDL